VLRLLKASALCLQKAASASKSCLPMRRQAAPEGYYRYQARWNHLYKVEPALSYDIGNPDSISVCRLLESSTEYNPRQTCYALRSATALWTTKSSFI